MPHKIEIGHGSGGLMTQRLIRDLFMKHFDNQWLNTGSDSAILNTDGKHLAYTTDAHVVSPLFFPGGDLGKLAICGTINDLAVTGAVPYYISASFIIEEGLDYYILESLVRSMSAEAKAAGVYIVAGDTKVVEKGKADGIYISTSGIGFIEERYASMSGMHMIRDGDAVFVSGTLGDHEAAIINAREHFFDAKKLVSDCTSLHQFIGNVLNECGGIHFMRDITRGGLAGILYEIASTVQLGIEISEKKIPVHEHVLAFCEALGYDPLHMACEGKCILIADPSVASSLEKILKDHELGFSASNIGTITHTHPGEVVLETLVGGRRLLEPPLAMKVPRIC